mgnify:FL=1|jgi:hypothetical protein
MHGHRSPLQEIAGSRASQQAASAAHEVEGAVAKFDTSAFSEVPPAKLMHDGHASFPQRRGALLPPVGCSSILLPLAGEDAGVTTLPGTPSSAAKVFRSDPCRANALLPAARHPSSDPRR